MKLPTFVIFIFTKIIKPVIEKISLIAKSFGKPSGFDNIPFEIQHDIFVFIPRDMSWFIVKWKSRSQVLVG